jgi:hypothetical protein
MQCHRLAERISRLDPQLPATEVARLCLLILNHPTACRGALLEDEAALRKACKAAAFRLEAAADQHAAVASELDSIGTEGPQQFDAEQIWALVRAIKVQGQLLELYTDRACWS